MAQEKKLPFLQWRTGWPSLTKCPFGVFKLLEKINFFGVCVCLERHEEGTYYTTQTALLDPKCCPAFEKQMFPQLHKQMTTQTIFSFESTHTTMSSRSTLHLKRHKTKRNKKKMASIPHSYLPNLTRLGLVFRMPLWKTNPTTFQESRGEKTRTKPKPQQNWTITQLTKNGKENSRHTKYQLSCPRPP